MTQLHNQMIKIGHNARQAFFDISQASTELKNKVLLESTHIIREQQDFIITENTKDMKAAREKGLDDAMLDRLELNPKRIESIAQSLEKIAKLPDPVGRVLEQLHPENGLNIRRISTPIGVIGIIYESRPNVTADAGALAMKAGNAVILRGGSESFFSSHALHQCFIKALEAHKLSPHIIQLLNTKDRDAVGFMLSSMSDYIDMIIPRGGKSLVARIQKEARIPVLSHLEGICHSYIHQDAEAEKALNIILNAKMRRTGICGATETMLVDRAFPQDKLINILDHLHQNNCTIKGDADICALYPNAEQAIKEDWSTEYLSSILSVKYVDNYQEAIQHIRTYGSNHTEAIITENQEVADIFLSHVDSAIVMHNASTQFADGGEFGMGAEIGIATGKIHARGPVGLDQLTCFKYQVRGKAHIRAA